LLDISNVAEYVWTTSFDPNAIVSQPLPLPPPKSSPKNVNTAIIVGSVIASTLIVGVLLGSVYFLIKRRRKNTNEFKKAIPTPGDAMKENVISTPSDQELSYGRYLVK